MKNYLWRNKNKKNFYFLNEGLKDALLHFAKILQKQWFSNFTVLLIFCFGSPIHVVLTFQMS